MGKKKRPSTRRQAPRPFGGRGTAGGVAYEVQITARDKSLQWHAKAEDARKKRRSRPDPVKAWERAIAYILQVMRSSG